MSFYKRGSHPLLRAGEKPIEDLSPNLTSMLDVVFLLLIFFVLNYTTTPNQLLRLDLPQASEGTKATPKKISLTMLQDGSLLYQGKRYGSAESLALSLGNQHLNPKTSVMISADADVSYQNMISLLGALGQAGLFHVYLNTQKASR